MPKKKAANAAPASLPERPFHEATFGFNRVTLNVGGNIDIRDIRTGEVVRLGNCADHDTSIDTLIDHIQRLMNTVRGLPKGLI